MPTLESIKCGFLRRVHAASQVVEGAAKNLMVKAAAGTVAFALPVGLYLGALAFFPATTVAVTVGAAVVGSAYLGVKLARPVIEHAHWHEDREPAGAAPGCGEEGREVS